MKPIKSKILFYILSLTWGLPMTLFGSVVALFLIITHHKPKHWDYCIYFEVGNDWGGLEMGLFFLVEKGAGKRMKCHEHGHGIQNCYLGPFMPLVISIPSAVRYWIRRYTINHKPTRAIKFKPYDTIWFEGQATKLGSALHGLNADNND